MKIIQLGEAHANIDMIEPNERDKERRIKEELKLATVVITMPGCLSSSLDTRQCIHRSSLTHRHRCGPRCFAEALK